MRIYWLIGATITFGCSHHHDHDDTCAADDSCQAYGGLPIHISGASNSGGNTATGGSGGGALNHGGSSSGAAGGNTTSAGGSMGGTTELIVAGSGNDAGSPAGGEDTGPDICPDGTFDHDGDPTNPCKAWSRCPPGQYIAREGTDTRDRTCAICGTGTFSTISNARSCMPWHDCASGTYPTHPGSPTTDQTCGPCPIAPQTSFACIPEGACLFDGACQPGTVQNTAASTNTAAQCLACNAGDYCAGGLTPQIRCDDGSWDDDGDPATCCATRKTCAAGEYISNAGSATADRQCHACASGSFSQYPNATQCTPWTECSPASSDWPQGGVATPGTASSDVVCADPYYRFGAANASDGASAVAVDTNGNVYVAGSTMGALQGTNAGANDAFVRKLDAHGTVLWTRQFGSAGDDQAAAIALDGSGNAYVVGRTGGALQGSSAGSDDGFIVKLDESGALLWTRQFGSPGSDEASSVAVDPNGNAYLVGTTYPTGGQNSGDPFIRKFDANGTNSWTQQFGDSDEDQAFAVAVDASGNAYVAGYTQNLLPASSHGQRDAFVRKFDTSGGTVWTQQFGTSENDIVGAAATDATGNLYVCGITGGAITGTNAGNDDVFVRKLDPSGTAVWTQQFGTTGTDYCAGLARDGNNNLYLVGSSDGSLGGGNQGSSDIFVRKLDSSGVAKWTKQIGTEKYEAAQAGVADPAGNVYVVGLRDYSDASDAFVLRLPAQ